jgi:plasmid stabilization system protein ParE
VAHLVSPRAEADLDGIWFYVATESGSMEIATRLVDCITDRFLFLTRFPYAGRSRDQDCGAGVRSFPAGEY